ncbi:MAG: MOSC domain-containing protein, partial [Pseudomonadota bacterium]
MKIESINIAKPIEIDYAGRKVETGIYKTPVSQSVVVSKLGLDGDHIIDKSVHGGEDQAVYLYSQDDNEWWSKTLNRTIEPGTFGENLTISSFSTDMLKIGDRLHINSVVLEITAPRTPCYKLANKMGDPKFVKTFVQAVKPGAYARVIEEGELNVGDEVTIEKCTQDYALIHDIFIEWHTSKKSADTLKKALESPISNHHRKTIESWLSNL